MKQNIFVIGGCRSGKSRYALDTAQKLSEKNKVFIATCDPYDDEMKRRIARHQKERSDRWITVEAPLSLPEAVIESSRKADVILVDCLTLWITNLLMESEDEEKITRYIMQLIQAVEKVHCPVIMVSNEVGTGIVPENKLARLFRDIVGLVNQNVARCADKVVWTVAGIPVQIK